MKQLDDQKAFRWQFFSASAIIILFAAIIAWLRKHRLHEPRSQEMPRFTEPIVSLEKPVPLSRETVDEFLSWVASVPVSRRDAILSQIALVASDSEVVDALVEKLFQIPVIDFGRHLLILSTLGEMRNPKAIEPLIRFIWYRGFLINEPTGTLSSAPQTSFLDYSGALQARAAEMLSFIGTEEASRAVLDVIAKHTSSVVRLAAIDAYLYNNEDSEEAKNQLIQIAQPDEASLIGLPRRTRDMNVEDFKAFDARVYAFYDEHPEERPPVPVRLRDQRSRR